MWQYQKDFIAFVLEVGALKFGKFELKSGRTSPYFFNAGAFNTGEHLAKLGKFYAQAIETNGLAFDVLFGPAYKGIPLAASTAVALYEDFGKNLPYSFNRKETKTHGEGGDTVGASLSGDILIIDDVITAGTAIREAFDIINSNGANAKSVIVALDRQEKGRGESSAIQAIEAQLGIEVLSIINLSNVIDYLKASDDADLIKRIELYRDKYGV